MSDLERPYLSREPSGAPSSCPVCGSATRYLDDSGIITCRPAGPDHFEWRPTAQRVASERADAPSSDPIELDPSADNQDYVKSLSETHSEAEVEGSPSPAEEYQALVDKIDEVTFRRLNDPRVTSPWMFTDVPAGATHAEVITTIAGIPVVEDPAATEPIRVTVTTYPTIPVDEHHSDVPWRPATAPTEGCQHTPRCRDRRETGDPEWTATELRCGQVDERVCDECLVGDGDDPAAWCDCRPDETCGDRSPCRRRAHDVDNCPQLAYIGPILDALAAKPAPEPVEGELLGRDYTVLVERRLHPDAAALAAIHRPVWGHPPYCWSCSAGGRTGRVDSSRRVNWPCDTADVALGMMGLTPSDIAITQE